MVLGPHVGLDPLPCRGAARVHVLSSAVASDKADRPDVLVVADRVHDVVLAVHDVQHALGQAGLHGHLREHERGPWVLLAGLQNKGVANGAGQRVHPQGNHGWEVEGADSRHHAEGLPDRIRVDPPRHVLHKLSHGDGRHAARELDNLQPPEDVSPRVRQSLTLFDRNVHRELLEVRPNQLLKLQHHPSPGLHGSVPPGLEGLLAGLDGVLELLRGAERDVTNHLLGCGVGKWHKVFRLRLNEVAIDEHFHARHGRDAKRCGVAGAAAGEGAASDHGGPAPEGRARRSLH
mmetsp:Transcript_7984/g.23858  ORF Transcript_7984/g.23858 Transcript_7984/m.23858 type:complete len:290 (-) Transcript_7984:74-943(-)